MRVLHSIAELAGVPGPVFVAVGVFDGVHLGHQTLIRRVMDEAKKQGGYSVALTFEPHPARVLRPESAPRLLTSTSHKIRLIEALGCDFLLLTTFDPVFAAQPPEKFVTELHACARPLRMICVGHQWAFGKNRSGNVDLLRTLGDRLGFTTAEIPPVLVGDELISSTQIRQAIEKGDFERAAKFLGREYTILGTVIPGNKIGRDLGFPTANLAAHNEQFPPDGVYAVRARHGGRHLDGVANIGTRPTVANASPRLLEVHIFNFDEGIYGQDIEIQFIRYLRGERKFENLDALRAQIGADCDLARSILIEG